MKKLYNAIGYIGFVWMVVGLIYATIKLFNK
jgi:hypothetical protein